MPQYADGTSSALSQTRCYVTTHDKDGNAIFYGPPDRTEDVTLKRIPSAALGVLYNTSVFPVNLNGGEDLDKFFSTKGPIPISVKNGSVVRMVDIEPGQISPMHRTNSLDYGVVLEGSVELILDDEEKGPRRVMHRGDVSIQRATNHAWRNVSKTEWARMLYVLLDVTDSDLNHKEDWGGMEMPSQ